MKQLAYFIVFFFLGASTQGAFVPKSFKAKFEQVLESRVSGKIKKRLGEISYQGPSSIRLEMVPPPVKTIFVSNSRKSWYYTAPFIEGEKGDVIVSNSENKDIVKIFNILGSGLKNNKNYKVLIQKNQAEISFTARVAKSLEVKKTTLSFRKNSKKLFKNLKSIQFSYISKRPVKMVFSQLVVNPKFSEDTFIFTPPKNTNIAHE